MSYTAIMLRRNMKHGLRDPGAMMLSVVMPVVLLLLFVGVFGGALQVGVAHGAYVDYLVAGILVMTVGYGSSTMSLMLTRDMASGVVNRFRTMAVPRASVLTGHVLGSVIRTVVSVLLVIAVALLLGFRPTTDPVRWLALLGMVVLLTLALTWVGVAVGLAARTPEAGMPFVFLLQTLPLLSSAFVPTDSMSGAVRWFAAHEPFTPITDTLRGLVLDTPVDGALAAVLWCVGLALVGYLASRALFGRDPRT
ncbi:ABC transporter permease [Kutzneria sp. NPDC051319]|uniref:ABC transporter permease n=1 Tax=Kutzneria sp. NPDC051319 TaxID=3155047 RepID=UPI003448C464